MFEPPMNRKINKLLNIYLLLALCMSSVQSVQARAEGVNNPALLCLSNSEGSETEWQRVTPQGEEFSILTPVPPTLIIQGGNFYRSGSSEKILEQRGYSGYAGEFIFVIESYKAANPRKLLKTLDENRDHQKVFESEIKINDFGGKQYRLNNQDFYGKALSFATKQHIYLITLASKEENNASITRFISSLILGENITVPATAQALDMKESSLYKDAISGEFDTTQPPEKAFSMKDLSRKAAIVSRPEPSYTEQARRKGLTGTVVLRGVFAADGQFRNLKVVQGLGGGLTERAVEAALSIRFFPAEKDGQQVSQYIQVEYNFNLY